MKEINIAVVGATGLVGLTFLKVLEEKKLKVDNYYLFASKKSAGKVIDFAGKKHTVLELTQENIRDKNITFALFSAGGEVSLSFAPLFASMGAVVIDNSSVWRLNPDCPLVVPEVNPEDVFKNKGIVANPNCSTIQAVVALKPLDDLFHIKRVVFTTFQAVSGAGVQGYLDLKDGISGENPKKFPHPIAFNVLPHIDSFLENGYTKEEMKMINETKKILHRPDLLVTATTVRVPVFFGHSESINVEFELPTSEKEIRNALQNAKGIILLDDVQNNVYPMPINAAGRDEVFVGRIRIDDTLESGCNLWVVADNVRKGAATNAIQILELLLNKM